MAQGLRTKGVRQRVVRAAEVEETQEQMRSGGERRAGYEAPNALAHMSPHLCRDRAREALAAVVDTGVIGSRWTDRRKARVVAVPSGGVRCMGQNESSELRRALGWK